MHAARSTQVTTRGKHDLPAVDTQSPFDVLVLALFQVGDKFWHEERIRFPLRKRDRRKSPLVSSAKYRPPR